MDLKILSEPKFCILKDGDDFIFYNSVRHFACRISLLDLSIFNLIYSIGKVETVLSSVPDKYHEYVKQVYEAAVSCNALNLEQTLTSEGMEYTVPSTYYLHLTYKCNLRCVYCYNRNIRMGFESETTLEQWCEVLDKILPYATKFILTGGEPFLYKYINDVISYIKAYDKTISIEVISNCMIDYSMNDKFDSVFTNISRVIFSCDNLSDENQPRRNFSPSLFKKNIEYIKNKFTDLHILVSSVYSCGSQCELELISEFCDNQNIDFRSVLVVPGSVEEIHLLPLFEEYRNSLCEKTQSCPKMRLHCGAGIGILSISPTGDVYPCQSLMRDEFKLGSLRMSTIQDIMQSNVIYDFRHKFCVDNIPVCNTCNVKYICAAGCRAATVNLEGSAARWPQTLCRYYKEQALNVLRSIPQMDEVNLLDSCI